MGNQIFFATPWWVNLLIIIPLIIFFGWKNNKLSLSYKTLFYTAFFAIGLGIIEASVVVYLRTALGLLPGYKGTLLDVQQMASPFYNPQVFVQLLPNSLLTIETIREAATIIMLAAIALATANKMKERVALFFWTFAIWDLTYYIHLFFSIRWPSSLMSPDVLFLIPEPWLSPVWFPLLISSLTALIIVINTKSSNKK